VADSLGSAVLTLSVDDGQFNAGLKKAESSANSFGSQIAGVAAKIGGTVLAFETLRKAASFTFDQISQLDSASAAVRTLGVNSTELGTRLRALSVELNNNISTVELTKAAYDVASSGFSSAADAATILRSAALGAKGGFAEVNDVASALTGVLNAYGLSARNAALLTDQFIQTQADGVITVRQYAAQIGSVASIAAASGVSIEELNAAVATATLRGVPVEKTFTGLRQAIASIIKPSKEASDLAESLGIEFNVSALKAKGFGGVLADVQAKTGGATDKIATLVGSVEAQAAIQPLLNDKLLKYNELLARQSNAAGSAAKASETNSKTISGSLVQIGNGFSNLATTLDTVLTPLFSGFIKDLNDILIKLNQVSALSPEKVLSREKEAARIVETAAQQSTSSTVRAFFGTPLVGGIELKYDGQTFKGTVNGVREAIAQYLLNKELANINKQAPDARSSANNSQLNDNTLAQQGVNAQVTQELQKQLEARSKSLITATKELELSRQRLSEATSIQGLEGVALEQAKAQLAIDKARTEERKAISEYDDAISGAGIKQENPAVIEAAAKVEAAGNNVKTAFIEGADAVAKSIKSALDSLQSASEGSFKFLTKSVQDSVLAKAREDIKAGVDAGRIDPKFLSARSPSKVIEAAGAARSQIEALAKLGSAQADFSATLQTATDNVTKVYSESTSTLSTKFDTLSEKFDTLSGKDWTVNVTVEGNSAANVRVD
jgi:TP901 family phage tail tape measure protein